MRNCSAIVTAASQSLDDNLVCRLGAKEIFTRLQAHGTQAKLIRHLGTKEQDSTGREFWLVYYAIAVKTAQAGQMDVEVFIAKIVPNDETATTLSISTMHESQNPNFIKCPPNILEVLTPTISPKALNWRVRAARSAAENYDYELAVDIEPTGRRSISVTVLSASSKVTVAQSRGIDSDGFRKCYEALAASHLMSSIRTSHA